MKTCSKCKIEKTDDAFNSKGLGRKQTYCRSCQSNIERQRYRENKPYYIEKAKQNKNTLRQIVLDAKNVPCVDCGVQYPYYVMDFDHREDKNFDLAAAHVTQGRQKILAEIAKCDVVCSNCHRERTHQRAQQL